MDDYDAEIKNVFHIVGPSQRNEVKRVLMSKRHSWQTPLAEREWQRFS